MKASQLRDLTRRYATGKLPRADYEAERRRMIDGVVRGDIEIKYRELHPPKLSVPKTSRSRRIWLFGGGGALLALLFTAFALHFLQSPDENRNSEVAAQVAPVDPGVDMLKGFLDAGDWSTDSLTRLENNWGALSAFQRESARRSVEHRRLEAETVKRIRDNEALMSIDAGNSDALAKAARLRAFATRLDINMTN